MRKIDLSIGNEYLLKDQVVRIHRTLDLTSILVKIISTGLIERALISHLKPIELLTGNLNSYQQLQDSFLTIGEKEWEKAQRKFAVIKPLLADRGNMEIVNTIVEEQGISRATLYRWLNQYDNFGSVASLVESDKRGGAGKSRISEEIEIIIKSSIEDVFLNKQRRSASKVIIDVKTKCFNAGLKAPAENTVRRFIQKISEEEKIKHRFGKKVARELFEPLKGSFPDADYPLAVVELDHTPIDILLIDEVYGTYIGKPFLTVAMDVYSRMVVGFYISFDPVGTIATALCISNAILPKDLYLSKLGIESEWLCWGTMRTLHLDNAREFKSKALKRGCEKYGISIDFRPVATPNYGGHIERLIGTFMKEVHDLPGTTFSNVKERAKYASEKKASMTINDLEKWFTIFITEVYHKRKHSDLGKSPIEKYQEGIWGNATQKGTGLPERLYDEKQVRIDFMPFEERSVQQYGIVIDHIQYYDDVLRRYVNSIDKDSGKAMTKKKFIFKIDPRDISCVYFLDPETKFYHKIPYRDTSRPSMSIWEHRAIIAELRKDGEKNIDEGAIFKAYEKMKKIVLESIEKKKKLNKNSNRIMESSKTITIYQDGEKKQKLIDDEEVNDNEALPENLENVKIILPFDGLDDE
jgi:putative transposase